MTTQPTSGNRNGKYEAPHYLNGASSVPQRRPTAPSQQRTVFPPEPAHADWRRPAYLLDQFLFFGAPLRRFIVFGLAALAAIAALGALPGRWWLAGLLVLAAIGFAWFIRHQRAQDFIRFTPETAPDPLPARLDPSEKIPVYVTGLFSVEGKYKRFTHLPGFYRTFATREHALLCLIRERAVFKFGHWPEEDIGMWYVFFAPDLIQHVVWGKLAFGPDTQTALAITYRLTIPPSEQNHNERLVDETIYIATENTESTTCILADLLWEFPPLAQPTPAATRKLAQ